MPGLIFLSGQVPADDTGSIVPGGIQEHTVGVSVVRFLVASMTACQTQCIKNLGNVLEAAGSSWEKVVKVNVYLKNMDDFAAMNEVYEKVCFKPKSSYNVHLYLQPSSNSFCQHPNPHEHVFKPRNSRMTWILRLKQLQPTNQASDANG